MTPCQTRDDVSSQRIPVFCFHPLLAGRTATSPLAERLLRALLCLVAFCVVVQATALSAQRTLGRAHHHVGSGHGIDRYVDRGRGYDHGHDHGHRDGVRVSSDHDHPLADATVVYVKQADGGPAPSLGPTTARTVLDLDGLMPDPAAAPRQGHLGRWPIDEPAAVASRLTRPLERPPRA